MALKQDWLMKQIQELVNFLIFLIFGIEGEGEHLSEREKAMEENSPLYRQMVALIHEGEIGKGEDMLFDAMEEGEDVFDLGILFYSRLNRLSDEELEQGGFSRREILEGMTDFCQQQNVDVSRFLKVQN